MLQTGDILKNEYEVTTQIYDGRGISSVWVCVDLALHKEWVVKEIMKNTKSYRLSQNEDNLLPEIEVLKRLDNPYAPRIVDIMEDEEAVYVVMDYIRGENLHDVLRRETVIDQETAVAWVIDVAKLLQFLHSKNIIYRDMKPENIILTEDKNIKVIDFGTAKIVEKYDYTDKVASGSAGFAPPEQYKHITNERSDIYSLGITLYQLVTGENVIKSGYKIRPIRDINDQLSSGLEAIITKATQEDPRARYANMTDFLDALSNYKKLEAPYIEKLKKKIKVSKILTIISFSLMFVGIIGFEGLIITDTITYKNLINTKSLNLGTAAEDYKKAIDIMPYKSEGYEVLLENYKEQGFNKELAKDFENEFGRYNQLNLIKSKKGYGEINYKVGEAYLSSYKDAKTTKDKLLLAKEYFANAALSSFDNQVAAQSFATITEFYESYAKESTVENKVADSFVRSLVALTQNSTTTIGSGASKMRITTYQVVLDAISDNYKVLLSSNITKTRLKSIITDVAKFLKEEEGKDKDNSALITSLEKKADELLVTVR